MCQHSATSLHAKREFKKSYMLRSHDALNGQNGTEELDTFYIHEVLLLLYIAGEATMGPIHTLLIYYYE